MARACKGEPAGRHSIGEFRHGLLTIGINPALTEDESDRLDTIYLPSKYPLGSVLPAITPNAQTAHHCLTVMPAACSVWPWATPLGLHWS